MTPHMKKNEWMGQSHAMLCQALYIVQACDTNWCVLHFMPATVCSGGKGGRRGSHSDARHKCTIILSTVFPLLLCLEGVGVGVEGSGYFFAEDKSIS